MADDFRNDLENPVSEEEIREELNAAQQKEFLKELGKKKKDFLIDLSMLERERIAKHIKDLFGSSKGRHDDISDEMDENDEIFRMERAPLPGADAEIPNYRTPISTVALEVMHANVMNVIFTPPDVMRVLPTEQNDIPKIEKLDIFGNWSMKNEMSLFENCDRLFHASSKHGEAPYLIHWVKEYGTDIETKLIMNPANPSEPMVDPVTNEPLVQEREVNKLLYDGPRMEVFSRKDYYQPPNALMDKPNEWDIRKVRYTFDTFLREMFKGKMYKDSIEQITDWQNATVGEGDKVDYEGDAIPLGKFEKEFIEFYGRLRLTILKRDAEDEVVDEQELEDEFIGIVNVEDEVLCQLRKNKFPLKERPIGVDYFMPDDEGRRAGLGIFRLMKTMQKAYDALFNQFIYGVTQSNNPFGFFTPLGNQRDEPIKVRSGYMYPTADPRSVNIVKLPQPDASIGIALELIKFWTQLLFGISDFASGQESRIDPDAPAKKVQIIVAQGNVRMNAIIKRKNKTLQNIFRKWFLLYKKNMPPNKFMRIAGTSEQNPWQFTQLQLSDFALKSIPDFELVGNILNANKTLQVNKVLAVYQVLSQNPFFSPQTTQGLQALHGLTKYLIDNLDETGLSSLLPPSKGRFIHTPEEENAIFLQGDSVEPADEDDHMAHLRSHTAFFNSETTPEPIKKAVAIHINKHVLKIRALITQQIAISQGIQPQPGVQPGGINATGQNQGTPAATGAVLGQSGLGGFEAGNQNVL